MDHCQKHILIVDDEEDRREMYAHYLTGEGYRVGMARDGEEALEKAFGLMPDLVLLDAWLPEISGWAVLDCLNQLQGPKTSRYWLQRVTQRRRRGKAMASS